MKIQENRLKVLWAITYTAIAAMQHNRFHFILYKSIATSWTLNYASHPSIYSVTLLFRPHKEMTPTPKSDRKLSFQSLSRWLCDKHDEVRGKSTPSYLYKFYGYM